MQYNTGYASQINQYLQPYIQKLDPRLQQQLAAPEPPPQLQQAKPEQIQRFLDKLQEESAEIVQAVSKIRRFGPDSTHPDRKTSNKAELIGELEDFLALVAVLEASGYFDLSECKNNIAEKAKELLT